MSYNWNEDSYNNNKWKHFIEDVKKHTPSTDLGTQLEFEEMLDNFVRSHAIALR